MAAVLTDVVLLTLGLGLLLLSAERLVEAAVGTAVGFGLSAFVVAVLFIGFDPENLAVGVNAASSGQSGIALGSVIGALMVAVALAFGVTALLAPMTVRRAARSVLVLPVAALALLGALGLDGRLSRIDGGVLLAAFAASTAWLLRLGRRGLDIEPGGEVAETWEHGGPGRRRRAVGLLVLALAGISAGGALVVYGASGVIEALGLSSTVVGMTALALLVSAEELARELPAARQGRADISYGNVVGSVLAFTLFNAGLMSLVRPVDVDETVRLFYLPVSLATVTAVALFLAHGRIGRPEGAALLAAYLVFAAGGYVR